MTLSAFDRLAQVRRHVALGQLVLGAPMPVALAGVVWRFASPAAAVSVALAGIAVLAALAWRRTRAFDTAWLVRQLDARRKDLDDSSDLLLAPPASLTPLQQLQQARVRERLRSQPAPDLRTPWPWPRIAAMWLVAGVVIAVAAWWPTRAPMASTLAPADEETPAAPGVPRLVGQRLHIAPPFYTGQPARDEAMLDAKAPVGSRLGWTLRFEPQPTRAMPKPSGSLTRLSKAPTRTRIGPPRGLDPALHLLAADQVIASPQTGLRYRILRLLGKGGFGQVYLARRQGHSRSVPSLLCIKISEHIDGWLREAYFGQLLDGHPRAIRVFDTFPLMRPEGRVLYCLALEYAREGDLRAYLHRTGQGWPETTARREIAGILQVLGKLHRGQMLHRDLTPLNVFVCGPRSLKLGDFGIVRQQSDRRGITARTLNPLAAPSDIVAGAAPKWQARDDVYQVGQLLAMLVKGDARARVRTGEIRGLPCSDHLKEIVHRCIGERRKRYESADELIEALRKRPAALRTGALRSLKGVHLAFTGILVMPRQAAARAARRAGAVVHPGASVRTTVVVRGRPNPRQAAGRDGGLKLMEIKRLREKGHRITLLNEARFWRLVRREAHR